MATVILNAATDWSTSASTALDNAKTAAGVGGTIIIPPGIYRLTQPFSPLAGQTLLGQSYLTTVLRCDFSAIANFAGTSMVRKYEPPPESAVVNPDVSVIGLCIDGGRSQCGRPTATGTNNEEAYGADCPEGAAGGISLGSGWLVSRCRITNVNGPKTGCFGSNNARIEYCVWDNDDGGTGGQEDNLGGGGCVDLQIVGNVFKANCAGSGIDITTGARLLVEDNEIAFRSLIMEGIQGGIIRRNVVYRATQDADAGSINIKSNTAYGSATIAGAWCSRDFVIENNVVVNSYSPGIIISSTWDDKGPGDGVKDAGKYGQARGIYVRHNTVVRHFGLGIYAGGQDRARVDRHIEIVENTIIDPRAGTAGTGAEWNSGAGHFACAGIGLGSGNFAQIIGNRVIRTSSAVSSSVAVVNGARGGTPTVKNTRLGDNVLVTL